MTDRERLINLIGFKLYKAHKQYISNNGSIDGFNPLQYIDEVLSDTDINYNYKRLQNAIIKQYKVDLKNYGI